MSPPAAPNKPSPRLQRKNWRREREQNLQRICTWIAARVERGEKLSRCVRRFARRWNGKPFRCDLSRRLALSAKSLFRLYRLWNRGGRIAIVFRLRYSQSARPKVKPAQLRAFLKILFSPGNKSGRDAFQKLGVRLRNSRHLAGYSTFMRALPGGAFRKFRAAQELIAQAEIAAAKLRLQIESDAFAALPPPRPRRVPPEPTFDI